MGRSLSRGLDGLRLTLRDVAEGDGDLTRRLPVSSADDLGQLAHSFNTFADKIRSTVVAVAESVNTLDDAVMSLRGSVQVVHADVMNSSGRRLRFPPRFASWPSIASRFSSRRGRRRSIRPLPGRRPARARPGWTTTRQPCRRSNSSSDSCHR